MAFSTSSAPHDIAPNSVGRIMRLVIYALLPTIAVRVYFFGPGLLVQIALAALTALAAEAIALRLRGMPLRPFLVDGSALITAVLIAMCLPPLAAWWLVVSGTAFAILLAKHAFGGLGHNPFNPAMVGYAVLLVSFPAQLTQWLAPQGLAMPGGLPAPQMGLDLSLSDTLFTIFNGRLPAQWAWDAITSPTPLNALRTQTLLGHTLQESMANPVFSTFGGRGWDWANLATLAGGLWLLQQRIIRWQTPVAVLAGLSVPAAVLSALDPGTYPGPLFQLTAGASLLGAFFIATDPVSSAASPRGQLVYGLGIGLAAYAIRSWGTYPDGVAFAVLLLNLAVPLIDRYTVPRIYGHAKQPDTDAESTSQAPPGPSG